VFDVRHLTEPFADLGPAEMIVAEDPENGNNDADADREFDCSCGFHGPALWRAR
jgi:hypothetical protein